MESISVGEAQKFGSLRGKVGGPQRRGTTAGRPSPRSSSEAVLHSGERPGVWPTSRPGILSAALAANSVRCESTTLGTLQDIAGGRRHLGMEAEGRVGIDLK